MLEFLHAQGVAINRIDASGLTKDAETNDDSNNKPLIIRGYRISRQIAIKISDLKRWPQIATYLHQAEERDGLAGFVRTLGYSGNQTGASGQSGTGHKNPGRPHEALAFYREISRQVIDLLRFFCGLSSAAARTANDLDRYGRKFQSAPASQFVPARWPVSVPARSRFVYRVWYRVVTASPWICGRRALGPYWSHQQFGGAK